MNIIFKEISIRNFLSFGNVPQTINLCNKNYQIITGLNKDKGDNEEDRNGIGKSSIKEAIHYALFGKSTGNKINLGTLVNNINNKNMVITLTFLKDDIEYVITRGRSPNILKLTKNGNDVLSDESQGDSRETQKEIEKILGFNDELYNQLFNLSCTVPLFLDQSTANQKSILEKILGVDVISKKIDSLKDMIKETKNELNQQTFQYNTYLNSNNQILSTIESQKQSINDAKEKKINEIKNQIKYLSEQLENMNKIDIDKEIENFELLKQYNNTLEVNNINLQLKDSISKSLQSVVENITKLETKNNKLSMIDFNTERNNLAYNMSLQNSMLEYQQELIKHNSNKSMLEQENKNFKTIAEKITFKENELNNLKDNLCPTCGQVMDKETSEKHREKIVNELQELKESYHQCDLKILELNHIVSSFVEKTFELKPCSYASLNAIDDAEQEIVSNNTSIEENKLKMSSMIEEMNKIVIIPLGEKPITIYQTLNEALNHRQMIDSIKQNITSLNEQLNTNTFDEQLKNIEKMRDNLYDLSELKDKIDNVSKSLSNQELLLKLLNSPSSFIRKSILDKSLEFLNGRIQMYLNHMGSLHKVLFNNDMSISITKMGTEYGYISSGEEGRVSMALTFAFRDVWETLNNCHVNMYFFDEVIDRLGLDEAGVDLLANILKSKEDKNIFLVTHNSHLISQTHDVLMLIKENDFTTIMKVNNQ